MSAALLPEVLSHSPLLRGLAEADLETLVAGSTWLSLDPGEALFLQGDPSDALYFVVDGELGATFRDPGSGRALRLTTFGPGSHLGEAVLGDAVARTATVRADGPCTVLRVPVEDPDAPWVLHLSRGLVGILCERLSTSNDRQLDAVLGRLEEQTRRLQTGRFLLYVLGGLGAYAIGLSAIGAIADDYVLYNAITSLALLAYVGGIGWLAWRSTYPAAFFGLTLGPAWRRQLLEALGISLGLCAALTLAKALVALWVPGIGPVFAERWVSLQPDGVALVGALVYAALCPLQEFLGRGVLQGSLEEFMSGWPAATPWSIVLASMLFGASHAHISPIVPPITIALGLLWGWMFHRHRSILGASVSHILIGVYGLELLDGSMLLRAVL